MEPISAALLGALAAGVGGEAGRQAWTALTDLVRRPFQRGDNTDPPAISSGEAELARLREAPSDPDRAHLLSTALAVRAALDPPFRTHLESWSQQAKLVRTGDGNVDNRITGSTHNAPAFQGRDFSGITFTTPQPPPENDRP